MGNKKSQKKPLNKFIRLSGVGLQMGITIYLAAYFGKKLDAYYGFEKKICTMSFILLGFIASLISLIAQLKKIQNEK